MVRNRAFAALLCVSALLVMVAGTCQAQQTSPDIRRLLPANAMAVIAFDLRSENPSVRAIEKSEDPAGRKAWETQQEDLRRAVEDLAPLLGISLEFAKDIGSWADAQSAFVLLPEGDRNAQPLFMLASSDSTSANATLQKILEPMKRAGEVTTQPDGDYSISSFRTKDSSIEVFASASGPAVVFSPSKAALEDALRGSGFLAGSGGAKAFEELSGSLLYVYADPSLLKLVAPTNQEKPDPGMMALNMGLGNGLALGISAIETGIKIKILGYPDPQGAALAKQMLASQQQGILMANPGVPSTSLATASLPNLMAFMALSKMAGMAKNPAVAALQSVGDTAVSVSLTAALPIPAGVISAMAPSEQAAAEKLPAIVDSLKQLKLPMKSATPVPGVQATEITAEGQTLYLAQIGRYITLASDPQSFSGIAATVAGTQPSLVETEKYKEIVSQLDGSNLLTVYANLAPIQGIGFLAGGLGLEQVHPIYAAAVNILKNMKGLGIGMGFNGEAATATVFLRAKPGLGVGLGPVITAGVPTAAAVLFPVLAKAREQARLSAATADIRQLVLAAQEYAHSHNGQLPTANWQAQLKPYLGRELRPQGGISYALNKNLSGANASKILNRSQLVMFFEACPGVTVGARQDAYLTRSGQGVFGYADGGVSSQWQIPPQSHWVPKYAAAPKPVKKAPAKKSPARPRR